MLEVASHFYSFFILERRMLESAKRCFHSLADLIGKELFLRLCADYVDSHMKKPESPSNQISKMSEPYYHPSVSYEWNTGTDNITLR